MKRIRYNQDAVDDHQHQAEQQPEASNETEDQNHDQEIMERLWEHFCNAKLTNFYERKRFCKPSKKFKAELERATVKVNNIIDVRKIVQKKSVNDMDRLQKGV